MRSVLPLNVCVSSIRWMPIDANFYSWCTFGIAISTPMPFIVNLRVFFFPRVTLTHSQIRDGQYGFSNAKEPFGRYCDQKFPDEIFSSDRYLWLRFHSDDNIEYDGFEGVFEYVERSKKAGKKKRRRGMSFWMARSHSLSQIMTQ